MTRTANRINHSLQACYQPVNPATLQKDCERGKPHSEHSLVEKERYLLSGIGMTPYYPEFVSIHVVCPVEIRA